VATATDGAGASVFFAFSAANATFMASGKVASNNTLRIPFCMSFLSSLDNLPSACREGLPKLGARVRALPSQFFEAHQLFQKAPLVRAGTY
jgi:hypothetical protein